MSGNVPRIQSDELDSYIYKIRLDIAEDDAIRISKLYAERGMRKKQTQFCKRAFASINNLRNVRNEQYLTLFKQWLELNENFTQIDDGHIYKIKIDEAVEDTLRISKLYAECGMYTFQVQFCQRAFATINKLRNVRDDSYLALFKQWLELNEKFSELC